MATGFKLAIPLPRFSKRAYNIRNDYHGAGWLWCGFSFRVERAWRGVSINIQWGVWWRLNKRWENYQAGHNG